MIRTTYFREFLMLSTK